MASGYSPRETSMILGSFSELPTNFPNQDGFYGFVLSANVNLDNVTLLAGTRIFGITISLIFHGIGIYNGGQYAFLIRHDLADGWKLLGRLQGMQ